MSPDSAGTITMTISNSGALSGTATPQGGGTISTIGAVVSTATNNGQVDKNTGYGAFNGDGQLIVILNNAGGTSQTTVTLQKM